MSGIRISPKHGLNPCIPVCAFCGKEKNEIAILGKLKNDEEAPMSAVLNYEPCDECQSNWAKGIALIRVTATAPSQNAVPLTNKDGVDLWPTGQYSVITKEAAKRLFEIDADVGTPVLMDAQVFDTFINDAKQQGVLDENGQVQ